MMVLFALEMICRSIELSIHHVLRPHDFVSKQIYPVRALVLYSCTTLKWLNHSMSPDVDRGFYMFIYELYQTSINKVGSEIRS